MRRILSRSAAPTCLAATLAQWLPPSMTAGSVTLQARWGSSTEASQSPSTFSSSPSSMSGDATLASRSPNALPPTVVTAATFEADVMQSQQAVILIFHIASSGCASYIAQVEQVAEKLNAEGAKRWAKVCVVNADENSNLASVFSVERGRLPVTFFLYHATIIDKVSGQIQRQRIEAILSKFYEYYLRQQGADVSAATQSKGGKLAAEGDTLTDAAPTHFLQQRLMASLIGPERIQLPQDAEKLEGLKKAVQQAKKQAIREVRELYSSLGMDVKRLSPEEMSKAYFSSPTFVAAGIISALEALFMARVCGAASQGTVKVDHVEAALRALEKDFDAAMGDATIKRVHALAQALVEKHRAIGKIEALVALPDQQLQIGQASAESGGGPDDEADFWKAIIRWADYVDSRVLLTTFPKEVADEMFAVMRKNMALSRKNAVAKEKVQSTRVVFLALVQHYHATPEGQAARARLSSIMF